MKSQTLDISTQGQLGGHVQKMRFDENSLDFLMGVLSNLYSDPQLAVIRELSINARDSHVASGQTRPIEVHTPTWMAPFFIVEDFGLGLSMDDITNIYSAYGASTKRDTNEQTGSLGLGSKSPLTLTDQFTVISVKDGVQISIVVSRTPTGGGVMQVVDTQKTTKPNGVRIQVPVPQDNSFSNKVYDFFKFWEPGLALVNGSEPPHEDDLTAITPQIFIKKVKDRYNRDDDYVIMGGIAYKTDKIMPGYGARMFSVRAHVPIGSVAFTPSREELHYTKATIAEIDKINAAVTAMLHVQIRSEIEAQPNRIAGWRKYKEWKAVVNNAVVISGEWHGEKIPNTVIGTAREFYSYKRYHEDNRRYAFQPVEFRMDALHDTSQTWRYQPPIFIVDLPNDEYTAYQKGKVRAWAEQNSKSTSNLYFTNDKGLYESVWMDPKAEVYKWEDIRKTFIAPKTKRVKHDKYPCFNGSDWYNEDIDPKKTTVYYVTGSHTTKWSISSMYALFKKDVQFFKFPETRLEKFKRLFPNAIEIRDWAKAERTKIENSLTESDLSIFHGGQPQWLKRLDADKVDDPKLRELIISAGSGVDTTRVTRFNDFNSGLSALGLNRMEHGPKPKDRLEDYPLVKQVNGWQFKDYKDMIIYLNAKYKELV